MNSALAIHGGPPAVRTPLPHFTWPPPLPDLPEVLARYVREGGPLSIVDRGGIYGELEDRLCDLHGRRHAILVSSGTMALYSAFFGLGIQPGDEVVSTVYSFHATATPLLHLGARIVFCDVEPDTGNIDPACLEAAITPRTKLVVTNDMWGHPVDKATVGRLCRERGLAWVEDCSHAHFAEYNGRRVGTFADVAVFSLQGNKLLTGGEGGVLLTDNTEVYERATLLGHSLRRSEQCVKDPRWAKIRHTGFGLKLRMHPLAAVMVRHLLEHHCMDWIEQRAATLERFSCGLQATGQVLPMARKDYVTSMGAHYGFKPRLALHEPDVTRRRMVEALRAEGLKVSTPGSLPFDQLPLFQADRFPVNGFDKADNSPRRFPGARAYYASIISLPTFTFEEQWPLVDQYVAAFDKVLGRLEELK